MASEHRLRFVPFRADPKPAVPVLKSLGYLLVVVLFFAVLGLWRGWFTVAAATSLGRADVKVGVDFARFASDVRGAKGAAVENGSAPVVPAEAAAGRTLEGRITEIDAAAQDLTLMVQAERSVHHVGPDVAILRDGAPIGFAQLRPEMRARLRFAANGAPPALLEVLVLQ